MVVAVRDAELASGTVGRVCVYLEQNPGSVSGMQMDLTWDPACLEAETGEGGDPACTINPETQRAVFRVAKRDKGLRALFLNLADTNPMPANVSELFCCQMRMKVSAGKCEVGLTNVIASDPTGKRLPLTVRGGTVAIARSES